MSKPRLYESNIPRVGSRQRLHGSNIPRVGSRQLLSFPEFNPDPILVPEEFELKNGILGIPSDLGIKLIYAFTSEEKKIRSIVAVNKEFFKRVKQSKIEFTPTLINDLKTQNEEDVIITNQKVSIVKCSNHTGWTWAFVDHILARSTSIFHLNLKYNRPSKFEKGFGVMEVNDELPYGDTKNAAMYCLYHNDGELVQNGSSDGNNPWKESDIVSIEVNTQDSTLHFSVNGRQQPVSYSSIPPRLRFCMAEMCRFVDGYHLANPNMICARYMHRMHEVRRLADSGDEIEIVSFRRFTSEPKLQLPPADIYDPDHGGRQRRVVEWNYLGRKAR